MIHGPQNKSRFRFSRLAALAASALIASGALHGAPAADEDIWPALEKDIFGARTVTEDTSAVTLDAPYRADDAALVPLTVRIPAHVSEHVKKLTLVIDQNPAPVVGDFTFGPAAGSGERVIETRVRVDMYSNVRAIVETDDGRLLMATKFVKAAGGCSAPALKDTDAALADAGRMQIRHLAGEAAAAATATGQRMGQVMIRHPQYSGLQLNQATGYYIPAKFLRSIDISRDGERVFRVEGGISLSEDPNIRFTYASGADDTIEVTAEDTDGRTFTGRAEPKGS
ncbi:MAG TPA: quinoprotein dehydrogenase-associated SoxYZ-like carrier [Hyphomicrobium sp.]|nr:quinoprotein dehydrogenase-associated SoxYZ-like carrier [Hyphomicrobium sp.]